MADEIVDDLASVEREKDKSGKKKLEDIKEEIKKKQKLND